MANRVTVCRSQVAPGQVAATGRGGNRARIASRPSLDQALGTAERAELARLDAPVGRW